MGLSSRKSWWEVRESTKPLVIVNMFLRLLPAKMPQQLKDPDNLG
jgi:hypothetical protein